MEVAPSLNSTMRVPRHGVSNSRFDGNHTNRAKPTLALFGAFAIGLLHRELNSALYNGVRE